MHISRHADHGLNQRGSSRHLVDFTPRHGRVARDTSDRDDEKLLRLIEKLREDLLRARERPEQPSSSG